MIHLSSIDWHEAWRSATRSICPSTYLFFCLVASICRAVASVFPIQMIWNYESVDSLDALSIILFYVFLWWGRMVICSLIEYIHEMFILLIALNFTFVSNTEIDCLWNNMKHHNFSQPCWEKKDRSWNNCFMNCCTIIWFVWWALCICLDLEFAKRFWFW